MYKRKEIDRNITKQLWFKNLRVEHRLFLVWLWLDDEDPIGIVQPDYKGFEEFTGGIVKREDVDLQSFADDCNAGKNRMIILDRGSRIWFTSTIIFKGSNDNGQRTFTTNWRDAAVIRQLAQRQETRDWFINELTYNERLEVKGECLNMVYNHKKASEKEKEFSKRIAKAINFTILESRESPEKIKEDWGYTCAYCGGDFESYELEIDHVVPSTKKGPDKHFNKVPACKNCNGEKADMNVFSFLKSKEFTASKQLNSVLETLQKKRLLGAPPTAPIKKKRKEKELTWDQVLLAVDKSGTGESSLTTSDFICINPEETIGKRRWTRL